MGDDHLLREPSFKKRYRNENNQLAMFSRELDEGRRTGGTATAGVEQNLR